MNDLLKKHNFQSFEEARDFCKTFLDMASFESPYPRENPLIYEDAEEECVVAEEYTEEKKKKKKKKKAEKKKKSNNQKDKSGNEWQRIIPIKIPTIFEGTNIEKKQKIWDYILSNKDSINNPDYDSIIKCRFRGIKPQLNMGISTINNLETVSSLQNKVGETIEKAHFNKERDVAGLTDQVRKHVTEEVRPYRIGIYNGNTYVIGFIPVQ